MALVRNAPLAQLTAMTHDLSEKYIRNIVRLAQRAAWMEYRDNKVFPGAAFRFTKSAKGVMGFSHRSFKHDKRKGHLPDYVFTGRFRDAVLARNPKTSQEGAIVRTKFSIFGGVMNLLTAKSGVESSAQIKGLVKRYAHQRRAKSGNIVSVREYMQRGFIRGNPSGKSYAEEWGFRPEEVAWVGQRTDAIGTQLYNATAFDKNGNLRTNPRVTKANLRAIIGA